jgi:hypothetical protein
MIPNFFKSRVKIVNKINFLQKLVQNVAKTFKKHGRLYNNTPSKAIVNVASNITYRPLIEADDTGCCTLII